MSDAAPAANPEQQTSSLTPEQIEEAKAVGRAGREVVNRKALGRAVKLLDNATARAVRPF